MNEEAAQSPSKSDHSISEISDASATLTHEELKKLIDFSNQPIKKWWTDYPFIISALAFVLSLVVTSISGIVGYRKDIHDRQSQLSASVQSLQEEVEKLYDISEKSRLAGTNYYADPRTKFVTSRMTSILRMGAALGLSLGSSASVPDLLTISDGLQNTGDFVRARQILQIALTASTTVDDRQISLRSLGNLMINGLGGPAQREEGDEMFRRSLTLENEFPFLAGAPQSLAYIKASTEIAWAMSLAKTDCGESKRHYVSGVNYLTQAGDVQNDVNNLNGVIDSFKTTGIGGVPTCKA